MFMNWKRSIVIPKPAIAPIAKIVYSKNFLPLNATNRPNIIVTRPNIKGFFICLEKLVTDMSEQAFTCDPVIIGLQGSSSFTDSSLKFETAFSFALQ